MRNKILVVHYISLEGTHYQSTNLRVYNIKRCYLRNFVGHLLSLKTFLIYIIKTNNCSECSIK